MAAQTEDKELQDHFAPLAKALKLPVDEGVLVKVVVKDSPADEAGIEGGDTEATIEGVQVNLGGDIIAEVDGKPVDSMEEVVDAVNGAQPGEKMELTILRGDDEKQVTVTLGVRPDSAE